MEIKRLFAWAIIALPLLAACDDDDKVTTDDGGGNSVEVSMKSLAGEWVLTLPDYSETEERTLAIKTDGSFVMENTFSYDDNGQKIINSQFRIEGKFKLSDKNLIGQVTQAKQRFSNWQDMHYVGMTDWEDWEEYEFADTAQVSLLKNGTILLIKSVYRDPYSPELPPQTTCSFYFKKGAALTSDISALQGTWFWWDETRFTGTDEKAVRVAVKFDGDNIDLIVVPWSQRFICKYEYKDGVVTSKGEVTFRTLWEECGSNPMNFSNPYDSEWLPSYDPVQYQGNLVDGFSFPIIADGNTAYSEFLGLSPIYEKQK